MVADENFERPAPWARGDTEMGNLKSFAQGSDDIRFVYESI